MSKTKTIGTASHIISATPTPAPTTELPLRNGKLDVVRCGVAEFKEALATGMVREIDVIDVLRQRIDKRAATKKSPVAHVIRYHNELAAAHKLPLVPEPSFPAKTAVTKPIATPADTEDSADEVRNLRAINSDLAHRLNVKDAEIQQLRTGHSTLRNANAGLTREKNALTLQVESMQKRLDAVDAAHDKGASLDLNARPVADIAKHLKANGVDVSALIIALASIAGSK